jgi:hypothetical protein
MDNSKPAQRLGTENRLISPSKYLSSGSPAAGSGDPQGEPPGSGRLLKGCAPIGSEDEVTEF